VEHDELLRVLRAFETERLEYVLVGAAAMAIHDVIRATEDIDIIVAATPENLERLRRALRAVYPDDPHIDEISDGDLLGDYPAVRYVPPTGELYMDIMTRLGEAASFATVEAETREVDGVHLRVATPRALYRLKKDTTRPRDQQDARVLADRFGFGKEE
jgi:hypothetical protein